MKKFMLTVVAAIVACSPLSAIKTADLIWHDMKDYPLHGTVAHDTEKAYSRLPDSLKTKIRSELWDLGANSAGLYIRFATDASAIGARWKSLKKFNMNHMTATGIRGLDLYTRLDDGTWTTVGSARPSFNSHNTTAMVITDMKPAMREYMLYLPLYDGVDSVFIGIDSAAVIRQPMADSPRSARPVVMYGTSILQGGCASRPGMAHTSILERRLDREVINLGFSGNARLDPEIAQVIAATPASAIVIDALPNLTTPMLNERMEKFVSIIRTAQPTTPIVLVESPIFPVMRFNTETFETISEKNKALDTIYRRLHGTDPNIFYFSGRDVLGDCVEGTVDNYHFTDMGFTRYAEAMLPLLRQLTDR